ncbi:MAG: proton-conducting transporter membrane subunit [Candidatus Omnitrophota bacterium]|jgi:multicomponent Na+:H+ antiporter subunit D
MKLINIIPLLIIVPLAAAFLNSLFGRIIKRLGGALALVSVVISCGFAVYARIALEAVPDKILVYKIGGWVPPFGICMVFDGLSSLMLVVINLAAFFIMIYSLNYMEKYTDKTKFYTLFSLMVCGLNGVALAGDLFNLFVFLEIASIASYALVAFGTEAEELEAALKYAIMGAVASSFILIGIAFLYGFTSTLNMADMAIVLSQKHNIWVVSFVSVLFIAGLGLKAAMIPFHAWLPDAHSSAPAPVSAMLSGVLIKTLGVYSLFRILFNIIGASDNYLGMLMFLGAVSIVVAGVLSLSQMNFKRLLAYSSISQIGYIVLGISLATPLGIFGGLFHLFNHSIFKPLLFLNAGAIDYAGGGTDLDQAKGAGRFMPVTAKTNLIASLSISGIPPFNGFFSKLIIIIACAQKAHFGYALCAVIGSIFTLCALMKMRKFIFTEDAETERKRAFKEVPFGMAFAMVCLAFLCLSAGLILIPELRVFISDAADVLLNGTGYGDIVMRASLK